MSEYLGYLQYRTEYNQSAGKSANASQQLGPKQAYNSRLGWSGPILMQHTVIKL